MKSFAFARISGPHPYGSFGASFGSENFPRGRICRVNYDSKTWFYRVRKGEVRAFKRWILDVFPPSNGEKYRIEGGFPFYDVAKTREK